MLRTCPRIASGLRQDSAPSRRPGGRSRCRNARRECPGAVMGCVGVAMPAVMARTVRRQPQVTQNARYVRSLQGRRNVGMRPTLPKHRQLTWKRISSERRRHAKAGIDRDATGPGSSPRTAAQADVVPSHSGHLESHTSVGWLGRPHHGDGDGERQRGHGDRGGRVGGPTA
jgi:hypothetical protein